MKRRASTARGPAPSGRPAQAGAGRGAKLFTEPEALRAPAAFTAKIDGAARGNPGPAAYGALIRKPDGTVAAELKKYIGRGTNNVAEYYALIAALDYAATLGIRSLRVESDSELLVNQMRGRYKVKSADLRPLFERAKRMAHSLASFEIEHVPRERNRDADALANQALDAYRDGGERHFSAKQPGAGDFKAERSTDRKKRFRARYRGGALYPVERVDLPEGAEVELTIEPVKQGS